MTILDIHLFSLDWKRQLYQL